MSLTVGELTGYLDLDDRAFAAGVQAAGTTMARLGADIYAVADRAGQRSGQAAGEGVADGVRAGAQDAEAALQRATNGMVQDAARAGDRAGQQLADGVEDGAQDARTEVEQAADHITEAAAEAGDEAGDALGEGLSEGGEEGGEGAAGMLRGARGKIVGVVAAIGAAAGAALISGITDALDQQKITGRLKASLGATPEEAQRYGKAAGRLYANAVTEDFETAADAISLTMRAGLLPTSATDAQIAHIATGVQDLADTFELDLGQTANAVGQQLKTGLAKNAEDALDAMTRGMQTMGPRADDLADTLNEYSVIFQRIGLDSKSAIGLLSQGMKAGARDTDVVADSLKEFVLLTQTGGKTVDAAFKAIGLNGREMQKAFIEGGPAARKALDQVFDGLRNMHDPVKRNNAALTLFGTKSEDTQRALLALDPSSAVDALGKVGGAADQMGDDLRDNASTRVDVFKRRLQQGLVQFLGDHVIPKLDEFEDKFGGTFRHAADAAGEFWRKVKPHLSKVMGAVDDLADEFDGSDGLGKRIGGTLDEVGDVVDTGMQAVETIWDAHGEEILRAFHIVWDQIGPVVDGTLRTAKGIIEVITGLISGDWGQFWQGIKDITFGQLELIRSKITAVLQLAALAFETALGIIWDLVSGAWDRVYGYTTEKLGAAYDYVAGLPDRMLNAFADWSIVRMITGFWSDAYNVTTSYGGRMVSYVTGLPGRINRGIGDLSLLLYNAGLDVVYGLWNGIKAGGGWLIGQLESWAQDTVLGTVKSALHIGSPSKLMRDEVGRWIPAGIAEGITANSGEVEDAMSSLVSVPRVPGAPGVGYGAAGGTAAAGGGIAGRWVLDVTGGEDAFARWVREWVRTQGGTGDDSAQRAFAGV